MRSARKLAIALAVVLSACSWTQYRGNGQRTGGNPFAPGVDSTTLHALTPTWTSIDHGAVGDEVVVRDGRVLFNGDTALWALDLGTGDDLWHVDRTLTHQTHGILPATTWTENSTTVVGMTQTWSDSVPGTSYFQLLAQTQTVDLATGAVLGSEGVGGGTPPLEAGGWVYEPNTQIIAFPRGGSVVVDVHARALDGGGAFTVPLAANVQIPSSLAVAGDRLYVRTRFGVISVPAHGCGAPTCGPTWQTLMPNATVIGQIAVDRGVVFDLDQAGKLTAIAADGCAAFDCPPLWSTAATAYGGRGFAVVHDRAYVTAGPTLSVFDTAGCGAPVCSPLWTSTAPGLLSSPTIVNDVVFAGTDAGQLVAWKTSGCGAATCPTFWSQDQGGSVGPVSPIDHALVFPVGPAVRKLSVPRT